MSKRGRKSESEKANQPTRNKPSVDLARSLWAGWICGVCGEKALEQIGFSQIDPRYAKGSCPDHYSVALRRDPNYVSPIRAGGG